MIKTIITFFIFAMIPVYSFAFSLKSESNMRDAGTSTEMKQDSFSDTTLMETELKKELSGKYEGVLEVSYCCENYEYKNGSVYIDLTVDPIVFIYSGVIGNQYFYENTKIFSKSDDNHENSISGWFEKINGQWVFWQTFEGYDDEGEKKPDYITKTANLESCKSEIDSYLVEENVFKSYLEIFIRALKDSDLNVLSSSILFPITDNTIYSGNHKLQKEINSPNEFVRRIKLYLYDSQNSIDEYFGNIKYEKEMELNESNSGAYILYGGFNLVFGKVNGEYKLLRFASWG